jgi:hypothetical protein
MVSLSAKNAISEQHLQVQANDRNCTAAAKMDAMSQTSD